EGREIPLSRHIALGAIWWDPELPPMHMTPTLPLHWTATGALPVAVLRSAWGDPNATYLAIKGGTPNQSHGHMDVGSFVFEAGGVRWALDLGTESYDKMRAAKLDLWNYSQTSSRWSTFRVGPEGHNLPRFDGALQDITGKAEISPLPDMDGIIGDTLDLTPLYRGQVKRVQRTVRMRPDHSVSLTDEWTTGDRPVRYSWQWLTTATVTRTEDGVLLQQAGRSLNLRVTSPAVFTVETEDVSQPRGIQDSPNSNLRRLVIRLETAARSHGKIEVECTLGGSRQGRSK
ncbi:MAG: heparinase II/III family protein, partial [Fibrella sp.]|nr:heparinase II/III family protein [Armatimonadota bacterium]